MAKYRPWAGARIWPKYGYLGHIQGRPISRGYRLFTGIWACTGDMGLYRLYRPYTGIYGVQAYIQGRPIYGIYRCTGYIQGTGPYTGYERSWPGPELYIAYLPATRHAITQVQAGIGQGCSDPISHLPTSAQPRVGSYISPARVRPPVYTRTRIMRARGRAHAPARGDKPLNRSRIRWFVEDRSRIQG